MLWLLCGYGDLEGGSILEHIFSVFGAIAVMILIIFAAYFMTKYVAVKANGTGGKTRYFKFIDRFSVSKDKMFVLIAVENSVYFIGVTNQGMTLIDQKDLADLHTEDERMKKPLGFMPGILSHLKNTKLKNTFGGKTDDKSRFSDFIKEAQQTDDEHDQ